MLKGKKALIVGVANERSIAWGIAKQFKNHGAELGFTYVNDAILKRVKPLAEECGSSVLLPCDVSSDDSMAQLAQELKSTWGNFDILIHSVAFANKEELQGRFVDTSRDGFRMALDVSAYSLIGLTGHLLSLINSGGSILTLSYLGATKVVQNYNVMGVAKAALEASVRYMAWDLGKDKIRVNCISAGPIKTLAASGVRGFRGLLDTVGTLSALGRNVDIDDVGKSALYLCSDLASGVTGEIHFVDAGYNTSALRIPEKPE